MNVEFQSEMPVPAEAVYAWHARPGAFGRLTPPWESVRLVGPHPGIVEGARAELEVRVGPASIRWVARHESIVPGRSFVDVQEAGPFARWRHTHRFEPIDTSRSTLFDQIDCDLPGGPLGELADPKVRKKLRRTFRYRHAVTAADLAFHAAFGDQPPLKVAISGASGLIGSTVAAMLSTGGHQVLPLVRRAAGPGEIRWDPAAGTLDPAALTGVDAVIHLAGENIAAGRWTDAQRDRIRTSRTRGTEAIARAVAEAPNGPRVLLSGSAIGIYGHREDDILTESAVAGSGFLPEVAAAWEAAARPATDAGVRTVLTRFGLVLSPAGGALGRMRLPFSIGAGAPLGDGRQWMSWISIDDCAAALIHLLRTEVHGPVNLVAPGPVTNREFTDTLGAVLRRPTILPGLPAGVLRLVFGDMADGTLLASTRVAPDRLVASGYRFRHPTLPLALAHVLGRTPPQ